MGHCHYLDFTSLDYDMGRCLVIFDCNGVADGYKIGQL